MATTPAESLARLRVVIPPNVREVCETLAKAGHEAVAVGGAVRDALLGREPGDWDVATSARPEQVMALFRKTIPTGLQHGTVTIVTGRGESSHVEVTTFRGEGAYTDARRPDHVVFGVPLVEDLARRDLRVNAMAYDPAKHELIDPFGGQRDLAERMLRAVGPTGDVYEDAVARFTEDGLRVMRAVRFAAALEFELDPDTERGMIPALPSLAKVSKERICEELRKMLATRQPSRALRIAERSGILALILPELHAGLSRWIADRGLAVQSWLERVEAAPAEARLGALIADVAKPEAMLRRLDRDAVKQAADLLRRLKFSNDEIAVASVLVGTVSAARHVIDWSDAEIRRLLADVTRPHARAAVALWRADGVTGLADRAAAILDRKDALATSELAVAGKDLIDALAIKPGPSVGRILAALLARVLDDHTLNTRDQLLQIAQGMELLLARDQEGPP
ncbi:MAG: hypothetical protein H0T89_06180 [Deltaproteobacteria bacterium]|nr:hypothetical protein [Deltaproteobacteria bacterium]MDQ3298621.1 hypothetical protein [Myxococcota bacterium]